MSVDGRDESLGDADAEAGRGPASPQVPNQGGPGGSQGGVHGGVQYLGGSLDGSEYREYLGDPMESTVPAQREGGVLPPPIELPPSDTDLIGRMRSGDDTAYEELYRRHADAVRRYARTCCRDGHTADDLTAEVFARMLQAVRGGSGPEYAVRAYLLTTVRRVAANWTTSAKREQLVDDFAVFATQAARGSEMSALSADNGTLDLGADVRAMHEAERSMAMQAFRSLPERWQAVLWHTEVEDESPSEVATLFGLDANGTRVLASRAREGLKQAYLQAHVSATLVTDEECSRYADRLGAYARGGLRTRAERGLRKHLEECAKCRLAAGQIKEVASGIPAVVPIAVIGWFGAAGYAKVAALVAGGAGAGAVGVGGAAASGSSSSGGGGGGAAVSEGLGAPVKAGIAAGVVAVGIAAVVFALAGDEVPKESVARPSGPPSAPAGRPEAPTPTPRPTPPEQGPEAAPPAVVPALATKPGSSPRASPRSTPAPSPAPTLAPAPKVSPSSTPTPSPPPPPAPVPSPTPTPPPPPPPPAPADFQWTELRYGVLGDGTEPEMRLGESSWVWQRWWVSVADKQYEHGVTVHGESSVTIDLNRVCVVRRAGGC